MGVTSPLATLDLSEQQRIDAMSEVKRELVNAYERIEDLQDALRGLLGLIVLLSHNPDIPLETRHSMLDNHRVIDAQELLQ